MLKVLVKLIIIILLIFHWINTWTSKRPKHRDVEAKPPFGRISSQDKSYDPLSHPLLADHPRVGVAKATAWVRLCDTFITIFNLVANTSLKLFEIIHCRNCARANTHAWSVSLLHHPRVFNHVRRRINWKITNFPQGYTGEFSPYLRRKFGDFSAFRVGFRTSWIWRFVSSVQFHAIVPSVAFHSCLRCCSKPRRCWWWGKENGGGKSEWDRGGLS